MARSASIIRGGRTRGFSRPATRLTAFVCWRILAREPAAELVVRHRSVQGSTVLFIDTQQYLDLYRHPGLKVLLDTLAAVSNRVFVTAQIADEVTRNKVGVAKKFFTDHFKGLGEEFKSIGRGLPNQLFSDTVTGDLQAKLKAIGDGVREMRQVADKAVDDLLQQIGRSEDDVSRVLTCIFARAVEADQSELDRARLRKERGRAPGKPDDALGDQITWEQFLACAERWPHVWIISRDGDYCHKYGETAILNASLYHDLTQKRSGIVIHCFTEMEKGLRDFIKANPVPDAKLPPPDEAERINKEQEALPRLGWYLDDDSSAHFVVMQNALARQRYQAALAARQGSALRPAGC